MATIQWFPGHMAKAKREALEKLKLVDIVIECVDARIPESSRNPLIAEIKGQKKQLMVLTKPDLADPKATNEWISYYRSNGIEAVAAQLKDGTGLTEVKRLLKNLMQENLEKWRAKGMNPRATRLMVLGIPNVGKSTFINRMIKKNQAQTANKPGVTKNQRWLKIGQEFELLDTPGILWPKFEDTVVGYKLALTGAIKDDLLHMDDIALYALDSFRQQHFSALQKVYHLTNEEMNLPIVELLLTITKKAGFKDDYDSGSKKIIYDIRAGKLGRFTLDKVPVAPI